MITIIETNQLHDCWSFCKIGQHAKDCAWFSFQSADKLCYLWRNCAEKTNESTLISSNKDCYDPESKI